MSVLALFCLSFVLCGVTSVPIVIKESSPSGESIIAISSSDPEVEKYLLKSYTSQRANPESSLLRSNFYKPETSFSVSSVSRSPGYNVNAKETIGNSRNFAEPNPFLVPFILSPNFDAFQLSNWFSNNDNIYDRPDPNFGGDVRTVTAFNDNGHAFAKAETAHLDKKP